MAMGVEWIGPPSAVTAVGRRARRAFAGARGSIDARWSMFVGLVVLNLFDIITTALVLDRGGEERNPFVQPLVHDIWQVGVLKGAVLVLVAALLTRCHDSRLAEIALTLTTGWYLAVVSWNLAVLTLF